MLCRVTNDQPSPRVLYDTTRRPITILLGKSAIIDLDEETYETHRAMALAKCGPQIEIIEPPPQPIAQAAPVHEFQTEQASEQFAELEPEPEPQPEPPRQKRKYT